MSNLQIALELLCVGMVTVFIILCMVVIIGNVVVHFVNKFVPAEAPKVKIPRKRTSEIGQKRIAAIVSAVNTVTGGKGHVVKIERR